ncbi:putrescine hydroxycinnamoyltransferase 1-like [Miscanthus floridulus]|uniref:putrescine hydroxycinnamoyltransferase 1-like n=1 Tax=Miscanthus floridulus TaxID=154761 RepID=UPI00345A1D2F
MAVEMLESCMVTPGEATPKHRLWLSIFDLVQSRTHTPLVYLYRACSGSAAFSPDILKAALSKALVPFYPLAGRLGSDSTGRPDIHCTGDGVLFVTARADATLDKLDNASPSDELRRLLVPSAEGGDHTGALLMFQVTFFKCGGVCLGTASHHTACDGRAFGHFMTTWAAIASGDAEAATSLKPPYLDRTLLRGRSPPAVRFQHSGYPRRGSVPSKTKSPFDAAVFPVSKNQILALKGAAGASARKKVSTYSSMVAHVWRCSCKAKGLSGTVDSRVYATASVRSRVRPPLPVGYLGNAIARTRTTVTKVKDIVSSPLGTVVDTVSAAVAPLSDEYIRSLADYLEQAMSDGRGVHLGQWAISDTDLLVVSWIGLPIYDVDFGWGRPSFVSRALLDQSNLLYLVSSPDDDGRLNVTVSMEPQALSRFKKLFYEGLNYYSQLSQIDSAQARVVKHAKL